MKTSKKSSARKSSNVRSLRKAPKAKPTSTRTDAFASKLNLPIAETIRTRIGKGEKPTTVAKEYGCSFGAVRAICEYRSYCPAGIEPVVVALTTAEKARLEAMAKKASTSVQELLAKLLRSSLSATRAA